MAAINPFTQKVWSANYYVLHRSRQNLPVYKALNEFLERISKYDVIVLTSDTGSGKTTQIPQAVYCEEKLHRGKKIGVTQNRRLAAQLTSERIAEEMDVPLGSLVGVKYKDVDLSGPTTVVEIATDGTIVATSKSDPSLSDYSVIIVDEAHQHTVPTDLLLGRLKSLLNTRKDLKVVIMSATINAKLFTDFFSGSNLMALQGREFPVLINYMPTPPVDLEHEMVQAILYVHLTQRSGHILVFVSGVREINKIISGVYSKLHGPESFFEGQVGMLECWPLHAKLSPDDQKAAVDSVGPTSTDCNVLGRKVIIATNIAETSITLTGVTHVIDSGRNKVNVWNPRKEAWTLWDLPISQAVAAQRAGRAGRTKEGMAWRMCTERGFFEQLMEHSVPEIMGSDMLSECLNILKMGGQSPLKFPYIVAPATETVVKALGLLQHLGAVKHDGNITPRGEAIARLPVSVYSAVVLLLSPDYGCADEMLSIVSMIEASEGGSNVFLDPFTDDDKKKLREARAWFRHPSGDHLTLFNIYMHWRYASVKGFADQFLHDYMLQGSVLRSADSLRKQLWLKLHGKKSWEWNSLGAKQPDFYTKMLMALAAGNHTRVAKRIPGSDPKKTKMYQTVRHGLDVKLSPDTDLGAASDHNEWVIYHEFRDNGPDKCYLRLVSAIRPEFLAFTQPLYWCDAEFLPEGHIQDGMAEVLARMTSYSEEYIKGDGMPAPPAPVSAS